MSTIQERLCNVPITKWCAFAAENGHMDILQWAMANGAPWDEDTCAYAAANGYFEIFQWARANGAP